MASVDRLLSQLNQTQLAQKDNPVYQVIKQLIQRIKELEDLTSSGGATTNITNVQQIIQQISLGDEGNEGEIGPPGLRGIDGAIGPTGAEGPPFPAFIYLEPEGEEIPLPIPGPTGATGAIGPTGADGPQAIGFVFEADLPEDPLIIPGPPGSNGSDGSAWTLIDTRICAGNANEDFINLSGYNTILVVCIAIVKSVTGILQLRVSTDNGATFLSTSGDYQIVVGGGTVANASAADIHNANATAARYGFLTIYGFNKTGQKVSYGSATNPTFIYTSTTAYNAIRVTSSGVGALLNTGTIYVYGQ